MKVCRPSYAGRCLIHSSESAAPKEAQRTVFTFFPRHLFFESVVLCRSTHPTNHRVLSVREVLAVQGFAADFVVRGGLETQYKQAGNAVPPPLARALGRSVRHAAASRQVAPGVLAGHRSHVRWSAAPSREIVGLSTLEKLSSGGRHGAF
eukprot:COSAG02_NODE_2133_length_9721_cov_11.017044_7_plen_150_part_00